MVRANREGSEDFSVRVRLRQDYQMDIDFELPGVGSLRTDEAPPLGKGDGPGPARLLAAAVANCLASSALFCFRRARIEVLAMSARAEGTFVRNEAGRQRIGEIRVYLEPTVREEDLPRIGRCLDIFEDYCTVTESVRGGLDVFVKVDAKAASQPAG